MQVSWFLLDEVTTLSKSDGKVTWQLSALLEADKRAKEFSRLQALGALKDKTVDFQTEQWVSLDKSDSDGVANSGDIIDEECSSQEIEANRQNTVDNEAPERDIEQELKKAYEDGYEAGQRFAKQESESNQSNIDVLIQSIDGEIQDLPAIWPVATALALEIATIICKKELETSRDIYIKYVTSVFKSIDLPEDIPIEIYLSDEVQGLFSEQVFDAALDGKLFDVKFDSELEYHDVRVEYDKVTIERYLQQDIDQVREQLVAQFPSDYA